ncbi:MAG: iron-sulfur cluster assembly accessory protein [Myxococcota bacterium]
MTTQTASSAESCAAPATQTAEPVAHEGLGDFPLLLTARAAEKILEAIKLEGEQTGKSYVGVRVSVVGGGCSGFQYGLDFVEAPEDDDLLSEQHSAKLYCDRFSAGYLTGTRLDYIETLQGAGFKFENPNAKRTCGCGSSFSV